MTEPDLSIYELADLTGRHVETLRRLARIGKLPGSYKLGGKWHISRQMSDRLRNITEDEVRTDKDLGGDA